MGCFQSKKDCGDIHPNVFRVVNIDEAGADLWSGQLEVTETELVLYREGRDATIWPLASLRRYGFDSDIFSFESGRRCATGEGIYAFRCRRAGMLFRVLQQNIHMRNGIHENMPFQMPSDIINGSPQTVPRQTLQASVVHRSSIDNGLPRTVIRNNLNTHMPTQTLVPPASNQSRSNPGVDVLEAMPLYPRPQTSASQATNVYQMKDFKSREHNNNQDAESKHLYSNDLNRELAMLRNSLRQETALNTIRDLEDESQFLQSRYLNGNLPLNGGNQPLSPTHSNASEHYAQLTIEQEQARLYMNIVPREASSHGDTLPSTPLTPKQPEYCNFNINIKQDMNSYANLSLGEMGESIIHARHLLTSSFGDNPKFSESDTFTSMSPVEELEVNYAVLDIETNREEVGGASRLVSPESQGGGRPRLSASSADSAPATASAPAPAAVGVGYTTIDFDKTVALTSVAAGTDIDVDGARKTRHDSACGSPAPIPAK